MIQLQNLKQKKEQQNEWKRFEKKLRARFCNETRMKKISREQVTTTNDAGDLKIL